MEEWEKLPETWRRAWSGFLGVHSRIEEAPLRDPQAAVGAIFVAKLPPRPRLRTSVSRLS